MEGAAGLVFATGLFQRDTLIDDLNDIGSGQQFIYEVFRYPAHAKITAGNWSRPIQLMPPRRESRSETRGQRPWA